MEGAAPLPSGLRAVTVREVVRVSVERDLLDPSAAGWNRGFLARAGTVPGRLRGRSRDRLDAAGETYFEEVLRPRLLHAGVERVRQARRAGRLVLLESDGSEHVVRPLARHLAADRFTARRFEFRDGIATGLTLPELRESEALPRRGAPAAALLTDGPVPPPPLRPDEALAGRGILVIGGSGFIGKVWLAQLLETVPEIGRVHVLVRRRGGRGADERLRRLLAESPVFEGLRRRTEAGDDRTGRVAAVGGDVRLPGLGIPDAERAELAAHTDLVVNCAGLTEFNPDPRDALGVNVDGALNAHAFAVEAGAALLHVSTCFVAGQREGRIPESVAPRRTPSGAAFDPEAERTALKRRIEECAAAGTEGGRLVRAVRRPAIEAVLERARELGWPNIYTYTKFLGEALLAVRNETPGAPATTIVRPSVVESALEFPLRGWNEGVNTSAPLSHLLGTHFRQLPVNRRKCLDVIPVDLVCRGLTLVAASLVERRHEAVVQLATSAVNPLDLRRAVELTSLAHRRYYRQRPDWQSRLLARLEAVPVSRERYGRLSVPAQLRAVRAVNRIAGKLGGGRGPLARAERILNRVRELIDLYEPFLLDNEPVFECGHVERLAAAVPAEDRERFGYDPRRFDWYDYWIHVHIPGLRRWSYPLIEGRPIDFDAPVVFAEPGGTPAGAGTAADLALSTPPVRES